MKPVKSVYHKGVTVEILTINKSYYVRKRQGSRNLVMRGFESLELACRYFDFVRG